MDFKSAFWQLELHPYSRYLTVFHANDKLYRCKRLTMSVKPAQGELNMALQPLFAHIAQPHLIHDDLIVATETEAEHHLKRPYKSSPTPAYPSIQTSALSEPPRSNFRVFILALQEYDKIQRK